MCRRRARAGVAAVGGIAALAFAADALPAADAPRATATLAEVFEGLDATFVLYDRSAERYVRHNEDRARERFSPCSTFKIPNSLIALETGVVDGPDTPKVWDPEKYPCDPEQQGEARCKTLSRDHTLRSALRDSVVWYYRDVAVAVGEPAMQRYLAAFDYGNRDISSGVDGFWLSASLAISADEQIDFLQRFYDGKLGTAKNTEIVKEILVVEETDAFRLSAKTGMGQTSEGRPLGWWVGYVERGERVYFFAFNMEADSFDVIVENRVSKARAALSALGLLD
jgi:beta-lactamase class D